MREQYAQAAEVVSTDTLGTSCVLMNRNEIWKKTDVAATLMARDYKGFGNQMMNGVIVQTDRQTDRQTR